MAGRRSEHSLGYRTPREVKEDRARIEELNAGARMVRLALVHSGLGYTDRLIVLNAALERELGGKKPGGESSR